MSTKRFLGYNTDENSKLVINRMQEPIVVRLYQEFWMENNGLHQENF